MAAVLCAPSMRPQRALYVPLCAREAPSTSSLHLGVHRGRIGGQPVYPPPPALFHFGSGHACPLQTALPQAITTSPHCTPLNASAPSKIQLAQRAATCSMRTTIPSTIMCTLGGEPTEYTSCPSARCSIFAPLLNLDCTLHTPHQCLAPADLRGIGG